MPPLVASTAAATVGAAGIGAAGQAIGGILNSRANNKATKAQAAANAEAIAMAKDNELRRRQEYDRAEALAKAQWDAQQAQLQPLRDAQNGLLGQAGSRLGLSLAQIGSKPYPGSGAATPGNQPRSMTLAQLAGTGFNQPKVAPLPIPDATLANIATWAPPRRMS